MNNIYEIIMADFMKICLYLNFQLSWSLPGYSLHPSLFPCSRFLEYDLGNQNFLPYSAMLLPYL